MRPPSDNYPMFQGKGQLSKTGANLLQIYIERLKQWFGYVLNFLHIPGFVKHIKVYDRLTNTNIEIRLDGFFTVVSINGKDFYFHRLSGEFDGSGITLACNKR